jgi:hypothetical protein
VTNSGKIAPAEKEVGSVSHRLFLCVPEESEEVNGGMKLKSTTTIENLRARSIWDTDWLTGKNADYEPEYRSELEYILAN